MDGGVGGEGCEGREDFGTLGRILSQKEETLRYKIGCGVLTTRPVEPTSAAEENLSAMMKAVCSSLGIDVRIMYLVSGIVTVTWTRD